MISRKIIASKSQNINDIGSAGRMGFGLGIYPGTLPNNWSTLSGTFDPINDNYGNYQYSDGSVCCWIPKFYYRIGSTSSPRYAIYGDNAIDILPSRSFSNRTAAENAGWSLHRAFVNSGTIKNGFMVDKYQCSKNSGGNIASSIKNGAPLLASATPITPFSSIGVANAGYGALDAAKTRGAQFHCMSRFQVAALALLATAHGQAVSGTNYCAWYDATYNFPKGNNNNALKDNNDNSVIWESSGDSGYPNCGKTGSAGYGGGAGNLFAKSTHNGQNSGVADLNGNVWEFNLGLTRPGVTTNDSTTVNDATAFYALKESVDVNSLTSGWNNVASGNQTWGTATHLATLYDAITLSQISSALFQRFYGDSTNQVLDSSVSGTGYIQTGLGIPKSTGKGNTGTDLFGKDVFYEQHMSNLILVSGGNWTTANSAGVWSMALNSYRTINSSTIGFRSATYI